MRRVANNLPNKEKRNVTKLITHLQYISIVTFKFIDNIPLNSNPGGTWFGLVAAPIFIS